MKLRSHETFHNEGNNDDGDNDRATNGHYGSVAKSAAKSVALFFGHDDEDHDNDYDDNGHGNDDHKMNFIKSTSSKAITRFTSSNS